MIYFSCYYCDASGEIAIKEDGLEIAYCPVCGGDVTESQGDVEDVDIQEQSDNGY